LDGEPRHQRRRLAGGECGFKSFYFKIEKEREGMMRTSILRLQSFLSLRYLALSHDHKHNN
jgi:hypothetical protein